MSDFALINPRAVVPCGDNAAVVVDLPDGRMTFMCTRHFDDEGGLLKGWSWCEIDVVVESGSAPCDISDFIGQVARLRSGD